MENDRSFRTPPQGFVNETPLGARIGMVKVAVRPPDPLLMERVHEGFMDLISKGVKVPAGSVLSVRSIDGYYHIRDLSSCMQRADMDIVSVVDYDPARRTFILSGTGSVDDTAELSWYAFEAFPEDTVLFHAPGREEKFEAPDRTEDRVSFFLGILKKWKEDKYLHIGSDLHFRGTGLDMLFTYLGSEFRKN